VRTLWSATFILTATTVLLGCSMGRVDARMDYWNSETKANLPRGISFEEAESFFRQRGVPLTCCVSGPVGAPQYYLATERKVGRFLFTEYNVVVLVALTPGRTVQSVRVERWGVGF
jgi:hypothetical protein